MMKTICFFNLKGGCGKTTSIINLGSQIAEELEEKGKKILYIDTDMQSNLTTSLVDYDINRNSIYDVMINNLPIQEAIINVHDNIDLLPSNLTMAMAEPRLIEKENFAYILQNALNKIENDYDFCLIDCSPSFSNMTVNAILSSDEIFIPLETEYYAIDGVNLLEDMLDYINNMYHVDKRINVIYAAKHDKRNKINKLQFSNLKEAYPNLFSDYFIRKNVALVESPVFKESIFEYKPRSPGAKDYRNLYQDLKKRGLF